VEWETLGRKMNNKNRIQRGLLEKGFIWANIIKGESFEDNKDILRPMELSDQNLFPCPLDLSYYSTTFPFSCSPCLLRLSI
jgi:hypothetical protein